MWQNIKNLLGFGPGVDFASLKAAGAVIIDVRTKGEFASGHIKGSINIPLDTVASKANTLDKNKVIITCCASGMRSASAASMLKSKGFETYNGGGWSSLQGKV